MNEGNPMSELIRPSPSAGEAQLSGRTLHEPELLPAGRTGDAAKARLNETAQAVGSAMGNALEQVRELPRRMQELKRRFTVIRGRTREDAAAAAVELRQTAEQKVAQTRTRAHQLARE